MDTARYFQSLTAECETLRDRVRTFIDGQHWATDGEWKESVLRSMLRRSAPESVTIGRGFVVTERQASSQIDVLAYDNSHPVLYRDGDLVFISPSACRAIIEVKSNVAGRAQLLKDAKKLARNAEFVRGSSGGAEVFVGYFAFQTEFRNFDQVLDVLEAAAEGQRQRLIDHVCIGDDMFAKFWRDEPNLAPHGDVYQHWHAYLLSRMAPGYFIHNAVLSMASDIATGGQDAWFPRDGKEATLVGSRHFIERAY